MSTNKTSSGASNLETSIAKPTTTSVRMDGDKPEASTGSDAATTVQFDGDDVETRTGLGDDKAPADGDLEDKPTEDGDKLDEGDAPDDEGDDLGEYEPGNEEVRAKFDAKYFTKDNELDLTVLSNEFWKNHGKADDKATAGLNEATYAYLKDALGITKEAVKQIEQGQLAKHERDDRGFVDRVGGVEKWNAAIEWGRKGGYSKEQMERFNGALAKRGPEAEDAADALMARFDRANPNAETRRGPPGRRPSSPERDATRNSPTQPNRGDVFATRKEHSDAWQEALRADSAAKASGDRELRKQTKANLDVIRKKVRRSRFA